MEEFKNLEVNREIVEKYEGKRRTMWFIKVWKRTLW
jgi:hypothetical protein